MKKFSIFRTRYVIIRDEKEIFCGVEKSFKFRPFDSVKKSSLKTYESETRALAALRKITEGCQNDGHEYMVIPVVESIIMATKPEIEKKGERA